MMQSIRTGAAAASLLWGLLAGMGCESPKADTKPEAAQAKTTAGSADAAAGEAGACKSYGEEFCKAVGEKSQECAALTALKDVLPEEACKAGLDKIEVTRAKLAEARKPCVELTEKLCADTGADSKSCTMVKEVTPSFPVDRCKQMMENYDQVLAELKAEEEKAKPLDEQTQKLIAAADAPSTGPADAPVTLVEFSDFECPYCSMAYEAIEQVKKKYPKQVRVVFRQFPLSFHKNAHLAHQAALAAEEQGKFWEFHDLLFQNQKALGRADLESYAKQVGLKMGPFKKALDSGKYAAQVDKDLQLGQKVYVQGTPTLFINGQRAQNATQFGAIDAEIQALLAKREN